MKSNKHSTENVENMCILISSKQICIEKTPNSTSNHAIYKINNKYIKLNIDKGDPFERI